MPDQPNVLEMLASMQAQQVVLQGSMALREALEDSGLPPDQKRAIRKQFSGKPYDADAIEEAIEAAQKPLKEAAKAAAAAAEDEETDLPAVRTPQGIQKRTVKDRVHVFVEGEMFGNFASPAEADAAIARLQKTKSAKEDAMREGIEEQYAVRLKMTECKLMLREKLGDSGLPLTAQEKLMKQFSGRVFEELDLQESINDTWDMLSPLMGSGQVMMPGQERGLRDARVQVDEYDKLCLAFDGFWAGNDLKDQSGAPVKRFRSLQEAYQKITKREWDPIRVMQESGRMMEGQRYDSHGRYGEQADRAVDANGHFREALSSTSWPQILGDSITRRMLAEYAVPDLQMWRQIVSEIGSINDFRTQRRMRFGGYGLLPTVAEGVSYTALPSPTDQEAQYAIQKRGGLETITLEMLANDDVGVVRRIPQRMGRAAAQTLFRFVFDIFPNNQALAFDDDTTALFTMGHGNLRAGTVLNAAGLDLAVQDMAVQTAYGNSTEFLGIRPRFLLHPASLWRPAFKITQTDTGEPGTTDHDANPFLQLALAPLRIDYWTTTKWYLVANPADIPTIEIGFFRGNQDPEIFVADQENISSSSQFEADKLTYKLRHIYGGTILDPRSMWSA